MATVSGQWRADGADRSMADLLDPIALEARLVEARARRAVALAARAVTLPLCVPPVFAQPPLSTAGTTPVPGPSRARPVAHRLRVIAPVLLAAGLCGVGGVAVLDLLPGRPIPAIVSLAAAPSAMVSAVLRNPRPSAADPESREAGADVQPLAPPPSQEVPLPLAPAPRPANPAAVDFGLEAAILESGTLLRAGIGRLDLSGVTFPTDEGPATGTTSRGGASGSDSPRPDTPRTARPADQSSDGIVDSPRIAPSVRTPSTRPAVTSSGHGRSVRNQPGRNGWGQSGPGLRSSAKASAHSGAAHSNRGGEHGNSSKKSDSASGNSGKGSGGHGNSGGKSGKARH